MSYLLAKYTLLFLLSALLSFILGYWWSRRRFVDVSESFEALTRRESGGEWSRLWNRLDDQDKQINPAISTALAGMPAAPPVDFSLVEHGMSKLQERIDALEGSLTKMPAPVNLMPLQDDLGFLKQGFASLSKPEKVDLGPLSSRLSALEDAIKSIPLPQTVDLAPLTSRVDSIDKAVKAIEL